MKVLLLFLQVALVISQDLGAVECPFPYGPESGSETVCAEYSACEWSSDRCHMKSNDVAGYTVSAREDTDRGYQLTLTKINNDLTLFEADITTLVFEVINHEDYHLQVKIYDPVNTRYEVPIPLSLPDEAGASPLYTIITSDVGEPFTFSVVRESTGTTIFELLGPLSFEDQFIQVTTPLASSYMYGFAENSHYSFKHDFSEPSTSSLWPRDEPIGAENVNHYGYQPYYVNFDDDDGNIHSVFFYNSNAFEYRTFSLDDGTPALTMRTIGGIVDLHFFLGPTLEDVNKQYTAAIGRPNLPIYWSLGFFLSRYGTDFQETVDVRERMKELGIPMDCHVLDIEFMYRYRDFTYDIDGGWAGLPQYIDDLHADGVKLSIIIEPGVVIDFDNYPPGQRGFDSDVYIKWSQPEYVPSDQPEGLGEYMVGYVWPDTKTVFPDYWKQQTIDWWVNESMIFHEEISFDSHWVDMNEPAVFGTNLDRPWNYPEELDDWSLKCPYSKYDEPPFKTIATYMPQNLCTRLSDKTLCMEAIQTIDGQDYLRYDVHPLTGLSMSIASYRALETIFLGKRPFVLSRSNFPGSGQYVAHWTGDNSASWDQYRNSIIGALEFNLFGIPQVGCDICGFFNEPTEELCARWMQTGAFYPFSRNHNGNADAIQDPARPDWETVNLVSRRYLLIRYQYNPYLYSLFYRSHTEGSSVIRPIFSLEPDVLATRDIQDQFLWGDALMIAPVVTEGATSRNVYFPSGNWYDLVSGNLAFTGPTTESIVAPLDFLPLYIRGGKIIPFQEPEVTTTLSRQNPFGLTVALDEDQSASGEIFWDDGESIFVEDDTYLSTVTYVNGQLDMNIIRNSTTVAGLNIETIKIYGYSGSSPSSVDVNGVSLNVGDWGLANGALTIQMSSPLDSNLSVTIM